MSTTFTESASVSIGNPSQVSHTPPESHGQAGWRDRYAASMLPVFGPPPLLITRGAGCYVWDDEGRRFLDMQGGIAVNALGHAHPDIVAAITDQASTLIHDSNLLATEPQIALAEKLIALTGGDKATRVFFANSGTEANEAAFKLARKNRGEDGMRTRILALTHSFHGRTMGALAMTAKEKLRAPFAPMPAGVEFIEPTVDALTRAMDDRVAALIVEPVQGEAGVLPLPEGFLAAAREQTEHHGALLIVDEVQTGMGRTGDWFGYQSSGVVPDVITLAKGLAGGVPIGAAVTFGRASLLFERGDHGSTFGGNALATRVAGSVIDVIEREGLLANVRRQSAALRAEIPAALGDLFADIRGRGLMLGIAVARPCAGEIVAAAHSHGLILNATDASTLRLVPPLVFGDAERVEFLESLALAAADIRS